MNEEIKEGQSTSYDLEERLLDYGASIIRLTRKLNDDYAQKHIGNQLLRSGTAPLSHHGEAQGAESRADFIHKLSLALKEMRESDRWLKLISRSNLLPSSDTLNSLTIETDELIRILATSIRTAKSRTAGANS